MKEDGNNGIVDNSHLKKIEDFIQDMKFGSITIIVQDGKVVQIDKTEKYRIKN